MKGENRILGMNENREREQRATLPDALVDTGAGLGDSARGGGMDAVGALIDQASALYGPPSTHLYQRQLKIGYRQAKALVGIVENQ